MKKTFPHYPQLDAMDCGPSCLRMIAKHYGRTYSLQTLREKSFITREGVSMLGISDAAESIGLRTQGVRICTEQLADEVALPCILHWNQNHFVVLYKIKGQKSGMKTLFASQKYHAPCSMFHAQFFISDPARGKYVMTEEEFNRCWISSKSGGRDTGTALLLSPTPDFHEQPDDREKSKALFIQSLLACENMEAALNNMQIQIAQLKESLLDTGHQDTESLNDLRSRIRSLTTQLKAEIQAWELSYVLRAPIDGTVTFTNYWIENQNVSAGEDVFAVIPEPDFRVIGKALLPVVRSGKVEVGQKVNIRLDNFPENEYGILRGKVAGMSLVPAQSGEAAFYTVEISLPDRLVTSYRIELPCMPNMQGLADIVTEDISLLERLILPIKKILKERG